MKNKELKQCKKCGCNMPVQPSKICDYCRDKEKGKKEIDPKFLVRGPISLSTNACAMFGESR